MAAAMLLDACAALLVVVAAAAFVFGARALGRSDDIEALYGLVIGVVALRSAVELFRPGKNA